MNIRGPKIRGISWLDKRLSACKKCFVVELHCNWLLVQKYSWTLQITVHSKEEQVGVKGNSLRRHDQANETKEGRRVSPPVTPLPKDYET